MIEFLFSLFSVTGSAFAAADSILALVGGIAFGVVLNRRIRKAESELKERANRLRAAEVALRKSHAVVRTMAKMFASTESSLEGHSTHTLPNDFPRWIYDAERAGSAYFETHTPPPSPDPRLKEKAQ